MKAGVYKAKKADGTTYYRASITYRNKHISLGSYQTEAKAGHAYEIATKIISDSEIQISSYKSSSILDFEKWICLINFRDNKIYFANPIYLKKRYFEYYIDPDTVLKFDMDDLFYYSSHKIQLRGKRLFVSDYGMQIGIHERFGIMNYAVANRDYRFINDDPTDFRHSNIEIINYYRGVEKGTNKKSGITQYTVKIHVNGNYIVGRYKDELTAAIAYNKAIDILKKNGFERAYSQNYIDEVSPAKYAEIYSSIEISEKLMALRP